MAQIRNLLVTLMLMVGIFPAVAQQFNTIPDHSFIGRIGTGSGSGPSQAVPWTALPALMGVPFGPQSCSTNNWFRTLSSAGVLGCAQPAFSNLSGSLPNSQMAAMAANTTKCNATAGSAVPTDCTASTMRTNMGVVIGTNVQAWDTDLDCIAALSSTGVISRTGAGTCSAGALALSGLATGTQDTVIGYWGSTTATAIAINNCSGALTYSTSTHTFGCNATAGTGTVTSVTCGTGLSGGTFTTTGTCATALTSITNSLGADVAMNNTANYFDGPSVAQGTSGTWLASGTVTVSDSGASAAFYCKLWDGTTVISSASAYSGSGTQRMAIALSGVIASPAANIKISCRDVTTTNGSINFNTTGNSKDSTLTAVRIQ
jgi:hypothetical protein